MSRAATSRLKVNAPLGSPPSLEWRGVGELRIDPVYQRSILTGASQTLIRRISMFWDWGLCQPLAVARRTDGTLMVVDGQHRLEAARLRRDIPHLPCVITSYSTAGDEAAAFVALNQQRRPLSALDLFKAAVAAEDDSALAITRLLAENGLSVAPHANYISWKPGMLSNIGGIQSCYRTHGEKVTGAALEALARGFQGQVLQFAGSIFPGIYGFIAEQAKQGRAVDRNRMADAVAMFSQQQWRTLIFEEKARTGSHLRAAAKVAIGGAYALTSIRPASTDACDQRSGRWCEQCDKMVSDTTAAACTSPFCKAKAQAA
jgi:hypothetical protein